MRVRYSTSLFVQCRLYNGKRCDQRDINRPGFRLLGGRVFSHIRIVGAVLRSGPILHSIARVITGESGQERWSRRLKVPLRGITWEMIERKNSLQTRVPGTGKDGSPTCATVKPFAGWTAQS
jgi:hypothetical protein